MDKPIISIIMPTFMHADYISRAIDSVRSQIIKDWELIIINDGSLDDTGNTVSRYLFDKRIRYFYQDNRGTSAARNKAIEKARGDLIAYLDSDDVMLSNHLEVRLRELAATNSDFVFGPTYVVNSKGRTVYHGELSDSDTACVVPIMVMHKKSCFSVGLFDTDTVFEEDLDLFLKMSQKYRVRQFFTPVTCEYHVHARSIHKIYEKKGMEGVLNYRYRNKKR